LWISAAVATHTPVTVKGASDADKAYHFTGYFVLCGVFILTLAYCGIPLVRRSILAVTIMGLYGILDEITQPLVSRSAELMDWVADLAGASASVMIHAGIVMILGVGTESEESGAD
jgi:VanZ family protein